MTRFSLAWFVLLTLSLGAPQARASLAREPLRRVLRQAAPALNACRERHELEAGLYQVSLVIDPTGKVQRVQLVGGPTRPTPAAESCLAAAFTHLRFETGYRAPAPAEPSRSGAGRRSRIPPDPRRSSRRGTISVSWPFVFRD